MDSVPLCTQRLVWFRCYGVPLHGWDVKVFSDIGKRLGKVVAIVKETLERSVLEYGRMCLLVESHGFITRNKTRYLTSLFHHHGEGGNRFAETQSGRLGGEGYRGRSQKPHLDMGKGSKCWRLGVIQS